MQKSLHAGKGFCELSRVETVRLRGRTWGNVRAEGTREHQVAGEARCRVVVRLKLNRGSCLVEFRERLPRIGAP